MESRREIDYFLTTPLRRHLTDDMRLNYPDSRESQFEMLQAIDKKLSENPDSRRKMFALKFALEGDVKQLKDILESCSDPLVLVRNQDLAGCTLLHGAVRFDKVDVAELLLSFGADCNAVASSRSTPLRVACRFKNEAMVRLLLKYGADVQTKSSSDSLLHVIALYSTVGIAETVYGGGIRPPVDTPDELGKTPLHNAAQSGNDQMCAWLIKKGGNLRSRDVCGVTPLMVACRLGYVDVVRIMLLPYDSDFQACDWMMRDADDEGMTALHHAVLGGHYQTVHELLQRRANSNARNNLSMSTLHLCAENGYSELVPLLLDYKADSSLQDSKGKTAILRAVELRKLEVTAALLKGGANPNIHDSSYQTPLLVACLTGFVDAVAILCDSGADLSMKSLCGLTCLHSAIDSGNFEVFSILLERCGDAILNERDLFHQTVLHLAARQKNMQFIDVLLKRGCSTTAQDVTGRLPLHVAAQQGDDRAVLKLAAATPDISARCYDGKSPFLMACEMGNTRAISALISLGANIQDTDASFKNAVMAAATGGFTDIVKDLVGRGIQVNYKDKERNTALHYACRYGRRDTVKALLELGACVSDTNFHAQNPLDMAVEKSRCDVAVLLMEHSSWEESLSVCNKKRCTVLNRMVKNTPAAVKVLLDKCVKTSDLAPTDDAFAIEFNYKYIEPSENWRGDSDIVFVTMLECKREELLFHPVCKSYLTYKWQTTGKFAFFAEAVIQFGLLIAFSTYSFIMFGPHSEEYKCVQTYQNGTPPTEFTQPAGRPSFRYGHMYPAQIAVYILLTLQSGKDFYRCLTVGRRYMTSHKFITPVIMSSLMLYATLPPGFEPCDAEWRAISYALLLAYLRSSFIFQRVAGVGLYFTMFFEVLKTMIKISCMMLPFVLAFTVPFSVMLNQDGFRSPKVAPLTTFSMAIGEFNFRDNFITSNNSPYTWDLRALFLCFCLIINFSLMNIMVGVAVGDISKVEKQAHLSRLRTQVHYLRDTEKDMFLSRRKPLQKLVLHPNAKPKTFMEKVGKFLLSSCHVGAFRPNPASACTLAAEERFKKQEKAIQKEALQQLTKKAEEVMEALKTLTDSCKLPDNDETIQTPLSRHTRRVPIRVKEASNVRSTSFC